MKNRIFMVLISLGLLVLSSGCDIVPIREEETISDY